jgi:pyruvate,orthophosphate dikinase
VHVLLRHDKQYPKDLRPQVEKAFAQVGRITGKTFGDKSNPLLVSVRSGARASMPGMMDTVLNLGLNDETVETLAKKSGDRRFAFDSYRRFITMYSDVVLGVGHEHFEELLDRHKERQGYSLDTDLSADDWAELVRATRSGSGTSWAMTSRRIRMSSFGARSAPSSARG